MSVAEVEEARRGPCGRRRSLAVDAQGFGEVPDRLVDPVQREQRGGDVVVVDSGLRRVGRDLLVDLQRTLEARQSALALTEGVVDKSEIRPCGRRLGRRRIHPRLDLERSPEHHPRLVQLPAVEHQRCPVGEHASVFRRSRMVRLEDLQRPVISSLGLVEPAEPGQHDALTRQVGGELRRRAVGSRTQLDHPFVTGQCKLKLAPVAGKRGEVAQPQRGLGGAWVEGLFDAQRRAE